MNADALYPYGRNFFVLITVDSDQNPTDDLQTEAPISIMLIRFPGVDEFSDALADALVSGIPMTVAECTFDWGIVVVHLPQTWGDSGVTPEEIKQVLATAEDQFFMMVATDDPDFPDGVPF